MAAAGSRSAVWVSWNAAAATSHAHDFDHAVALNGREKQLLDTQASRQQGWATPKAFCR